MKKEKEIEKCRWEEENRQWRCELCAYICDLRKKELDVEKMFAHISKNNPSKRDEIDDWLERECGIRSGCCSAVESLKYNVGREVVIKLIDTIKRKLLFNEFLKEE